MSIVSKHSLAQRQLYEAFVAAASNGGYTPSDVIVAAVMVFNEAHRRCNRNWSGAEAEFDRTVARAKQLLREKYLLDGRRRPPNLLDDDAGQLFIKH